MEFKAIYNGIAYNVPLFGLRTDGDILSIKFDTGASNTVISVQALWEKECAGKEIWNYCDENNIPIRTFHSASGHLMHGVEVVAKDILMGNQKLNNFYYNLLLDVRNNVALLGDDFLSFCDFKHMKMSSISISDFDFEEYEKKKSSAILQSKIDEILEIH